MTLLGIGGNGSAPIQQANFQQSSYSANLASLQAVDSSLTINNKIQFDNTGKLTYAPNNLALNTATLSTQTVTVTTAINYIVSFYGTGSVTLSGAAAGTITGTGVGNQVYLKITATSASLTLTVSGSVTNAVVAAITYETTPRTQDQVNTTSTAYYGPRFDYYYTGSAWSPNGLLIERDLTNYIYPSGPIGTAPWGLNGATYTPNYAVAPNGTTTASRLVSAGGINVSYSTTELTTAFTFSVWLKKDAASTSDFYIYDPTGGGIVQQGRINFDTSTVSNTIGTSVKLINANPDGWFRVSITTTGTSTSGFSVGLYATTSVIAWGAQFEKDSFAVSYVPATTAAVAYAQDTFNVTKYAPNAQIWQRKNQITGVTDRIYYAAGSLPSPMPTDYWYQSAGMYSRNLTVAERSSKLIVGNPY